MPKLFPYGREHCKCCRLPADAIGSWIQMNGIRKAEVLSHHEIEEKIAVKDPVFWAHLNLTLRENFRDDTTGEVLIPRGTPWTLWPVQAKMARLAGNIVIESASEVGKTCDLVLQVLHRADTQENITSILVAGDSDKTLFKAMKEIEYQLDQNQSIGGGVVSSRVKPYREIILKNGTEIDGIMCGFEGQQFRGGHYDLVLADEVAKWKNPAQWNEFWRAGKPGSEFRIYSTPDGDYSSPFYALCQRAVPIDKQGSSRRRLARGDPDEPKFRKMNISRRDLPHWSEGRAAKYREQFGPESSVGWLTNVEGKWGAPSYSVFPMHTLRSNLATAAELPFYRMVAVTIDHDRGEYSLSAAELSPELGSADGIRSENLLSRGSRTYRGGDLMANEIATFFPSAEVAGWTTPVLICGADLGSAQDPTEILFVRQIGDIWSDVFRLHLKFGDPEKDHAAIFDALDHASGHQAKYSLDSGSFGNMLVSKLTAWNRVCPVCEAPLNFGERLSGRGFGNYTDVVDIKTGEPVLDPDKKGANGESGIRRASNKEFSTQILERKAQAGELRIAWDGGAGDPSLSGPQLLINHTARGKNSKGERNFKGEDDHHVDARRQIALAIVADLAEQSGHLPSPAPDNVVSIGEGRAARRILWDGVREGGMRGLFGHSGGFKGIFR